MYHLRLIKGLSYLGAVHATQRDPDVYTADETAASAAVASGYFELIEGAVSDDIAGTEAELETAEERPDFEALAAMNKAELSAFAVEHSIDLTGCRTKADMLGAISVAYGGSYTMIDLQRENKRRTLS